VLLAQAGHLGVGNCRPLRQQNEADFSVNHALLGDAAQHGYGNGSVKLDATRRNSCYDRRLMNAV
jgi:hypothetical protein